MSSFSFGILFVRITYRSLFIGCLCIIYRILIICPGNSRIIYHISVIGSGNSRIIYHIPVISPGNSRIIYHISVIGSGNSYIIYHIPVIGPGNPRIIYHISVIGSGNSRIIYRLLITFLDNFCIIRIFWYVAGFSALVSFPVVIYLFSAAWTKLCMIRQRCSTKFASHAIPPLSSHIYLHFETLL